MMQEAFPLRGVVEGFYDTFYTAPERDGLIRFIARHGYNLYIYGPKTDRWHRERWREPYPPALMARFARTVALAREVGVTFCYALAPGLTMRYSAAADQEALRNKLQAFHEIGVRAFTLLLDDIEPDLRHPADRARFGSAAQAQALLCNELYDWLQELGAPCALSICPTEYHGRAPFTDALHQLGTWLRPEIDLFYTGPEICSPTVEGADVAAFARAASRPPILWDNYPVNDLEMQAEMHLGPIRNRAGELAGRVRGIVVNPMNQAEASKIPLLTYADYFRDPLGYDPEAAWSRALREVAGEAAGPLRRFAENSLHSCLGVPEAARLSELVEGALVALEQGEAPSSSPALLALESYILVLEDSGYYLKNQMENLALRNDLLPWIELLELWCWMAKRALQVLRAIDKGEPAEGATRRLGELLGVARGHHKRVAGNVLVPLAEYALARARRAAEQGWREAGAA